MSAQKYQGNYSPREAAASIAVDALINELRLLNSPNSQFYHDTPSYQARVKKQLEKMAGKIADKHGFDYVLPE
jgi:hypothetical protein